MRGRRIAQCGAVAVCLALAGPALADPAIVAGGPASGADRRGLERALSDVAGGLAVCWRGKRPHEVQVTLKVAASGEVRAAAAKTRGKVASCAAAVLAVQTLAPARKGYRATVSFPTRGSGGGDRDAVMKGVRTNRALAACYRNEPKLRGAIQIRFLVKPNGHVVDAEVIESSLSDAAVGRCLVAALERIRLGKLSTRKTVEFVLPLRFDGGGGGPRAGNRDPALQPQKHGPLGSDVLTEVMTAARPKFSACYANRLRKKPDIAGDVVLRYTVRADGKPYNVKIKRTTLNDAVVESCLVRVGKKLRFPAQSGREDTKVIYPFRFKRE